MDLLGYHPSNTETLRQIKYGINVWQRLYNCTVMVRHFFSIAPAVTMFSWTKDSERVISFTMTHINEVCHVFFLLQGREIKLL